MSWNFVLPTPKFWKQLQEGITWRRGVIFSETAFAWGFGMEALHQDRTNIHWLDGGELQGTIKSILDDFMDTFKKKINKTKVNLYSFLKLISGME